MGSTDSRNSEDNIYDVLRTDILNLKLRPGMIFSIRISARPTRWEGRR